MHEARTTSGSSSTVVVMSPMLTGLPLLLILSNDNCDAPSLPRQSWSIEKLMPRLMLGKHCECSAFHTSLRPVAGSCHIMS